MKPFPFILLFLLIPGAGFLSAQETEELYLKTEGTRFHGAPVIRLQRYLLSRGFTLGPDGVDGWFGGDTDKALRAFQKAEGLPVTGRIAAADIPEKLEWKRVLEHKAPRGRPELSRAEPYKIEKDGTYNTGYGPFTIDSTRYGEAQFVLPRIFSPNKRFYYTQYYTPEAELQMGQPLIIFDTLTEKEDHLSALNAYIDVNDPGYGDLYEQTYFSQFMTVQWTEDNNLYMELAVDRRDGTRLKASRLFQTRVRR